MSVSAGIQTAVTTVPARRHPVSTWIFTWHRVTEARQPQSIREPKPTMRAVIRGRTTFSHPYSAAILGAVHVDATARFATRREYDAAIRIVKDDVIYRDR